MLKGVISITSIFSVTTVVVVLATSQIATASSTSDEKNSYKTQLLGAAKAVYEVGPIRVPSPSDNPQTPGGSR